MKTCVKCKIEKELTDFPPSELKRKSSRCRNCLSLQGKQWAKDNPDKVKANNKRWYQNNPENKKLNDQKYRETHPEKIIAKNKKWYQNNTKKSNVQSTQWRQNNPKKVAVIDKKSKHKNKDKINAKERERYQNDIVYRLQSIASVMVYDMLRSQVASKNNQRSSNYFPWTADELVAHIISLFEPWMTQNNQGIYDPKTWDDNDQKTWKWQLDHIIPQSDLPYNSMRHPNFLKAWSLSNLRPLSAKQNLLDGANKIRHKKK